MKIKTFIYPALSLSLFACTVPPQTNPSITNSTIESATENALQEQSVHFTYEAPTGFQTQAVNPNQLKYIKLTLVGEDIDGELQNTEGLVEVSLGKAAATIENVPIQPGKIRVVSVQGYDANKNPLAAFVGKGIYFSKRGVATVNIQVNRRQILVGKVAEKLIAKKSAVASNLDYNRLQSHFDELTGYKDKKFVLDPTLLQLDKIVVLIEKEGTIPSAENMRAEAILKNSLTVYLEAETTRPTDENITVRISDPSTKAQVIERGESFPRALNFSDVSPGKWTFSAYNAAGKIFASANVSVAADGVATTDMGATPTERLLLEEVLFVPEASLSVNTNTVTEANAEVTYTATLDRKTGTQPATITLDNDVVITIPAQSTEGTATHIIKSDDPYVNAGIRSAAISETQGGGFFSILINPATVSVQVNDTIDTVTASLAVSKATATEGEDLVYTASLTAPSQGNTTINLSNGEIITVADGESSGTVTVSIPDDPYVTPPVSVQITAATNANFEKLVHNATPVVTQITDIMTETTASISGIDFVIEGSAVPTVASLSAPSKGQTTFALQDGRQIVIADGQTSGQISKGTSDDVYTFFQPDVTVSLNSVSNTAFEKIVMGNRSVITDLQNSATPSQITLTAPTSVDEGEDITYTASLSHPSVGNTIFNRENSVIPITIPDGQTSASFTVSTAGKGGQTVTNRITSIFQSQFEALQITSGAVSTSVQELAVDVRVDNCRIMNNSDGFPRGWCDVILSRPVKAGASPFVISATSYERNTSNEWLNDGNPFQVAINPGETVGTFMSGRPKYPAGNATGDVRYILHNMSGGGFGQVNLNVESANTAGLSFLPSGIVGQKSHQY